MIHLFSELCLREYIIKFIKLHDPITLVHRARVYKYLPKIDLWFCSRHKMLATSSYNAQFFSKPLSK